MNSKNIFKETQRFRQWWIWLPLIALCLFFIYVIVKQTILGEETLNEESISSHILFASLGVSVYLVLLFIFAKLETSITAEGISVRLFPFHLKYKQISWSQISSLSIRKYSSFREYGGWGIRRGLDGKAYNVSGNMGLQIEFNDRKKLLIGTNKPHELEDVLLTLGKLENNN